MVCVIKCELLFICGQLVIKCELILLSIYRGMHWVRKHDIGIFITDEMQDKRHWQNSLNNTKVCNMLLQCESHIVVIVFFLAIEMRKF